MTTAITIQARMGSTRLPGKVLKDAVGKPMLELMIERLKRVPGADKIIVATTDKPTDDPIVDLAKRTGVNFYRGSEDDVLSRVLEAAQFHAVDVIVETTGDCPLIDPNVIQKIIDTYNATGADYASNVIERSYPIGMDTQVFATDILVDVAARTDDPQDHEHVSLFIYHHPEIYRLKNVLAPKNLTAPDWRLTLDTPEDYDMIRRVFEALYPDKPAFTLADMFALFKKRPELLEINSHVQHNWIRKDS